MTEGRGRSQMDRTVSKRGAATPLFFWGEVGLTPFSDECYSADMKRVLCLLCLCLSVFPFPALLFAVETAPRISDREIVERLTRLETEIQAVHEAVGQLREENRELREENRQLREDMNAQFDRISNHMDVMLGVFATLTAATIGFAVWDRRTMIRPFESKIKSVEASLAENTERLHALLEALRAAGKTDPNTAEVLRKFHLL